MATYQQQEVQITLPPGNLQPSTENAAIGIGESTALLPQNPTAAQSRWRCCVQSKGTVLILVWNICVTFGLEYFSPLLSGISGDNATVRIIVDAILAVFLLFYPLAGYLADVRWGRYNTIFGSIRFILVTLLIFYFLGILGTCMALSIALTIDYNDYYPYDETLGPIKIVSIIVSCLFFGLPILLGILLIILSLIAFSANVIQYGIDQLEYDNRGGNFIQYVYWYVWTCYMGQLIINIVITLFGIFGSYLANSGIFLIVLPIVIGITFCIKGKLDLVKTPPLTENPYKLINRIINFALSHNHLLRLRSNNHNEARPSSQLDLAKEMYGGPFTTNQVEEVKSFLRILCVLFTLGPVLMADIAVRELLPRLARHMDTTVYIYPTVIFTYPYNNPLKNLISSGALTPLIIVVVLPLYMYVLRPCLYNYIPGVLKRIGLGMVFIFLSAFCTLVMDMSGHIQSQHGNATLPVKTCFLTTDLYYYDPEYGNWYPTLHISSYVLTIQCVLNAIGYMLFYISTFEFICAQSPRSVKGVLICSFFAIKGGFRLLGDLVLYAPFLNWHFSYTFPSCGFIYYLINAVLVLAGLVVFAIAAKKYQPQSPGPPDYTEQYSNTEGHSSAVDQNDTGF